MTTMLEIFNKSRALLDEYTEDGTLIPEGEVVDMQNKAILFADMAQKELYQVSRIEKTLSLSHSSAPNLIGGGFEQVDFVGTTQEYGPVSGAKAYYFEAEGEGTAYIKTISDVVVDTITFNTDAYTAFKGLIYTSEPVKLVFSGSYHYRHRNRCLYSYPFRIDKIPTYSEWYEVDMPSDFMDITQVVKVSLMSPHSLYTEYKTEEPNKIYLNYGFNGEYKVTYRPIPATISAITDVLECNNVIAQAIPYYVAANLAPYENQGLTNLMWSKYAELKQQASLKRPVAWDRVDNTYKIGSGV